MLQHSHTSECWNHAKKLDRSMNLASQANVARLWRRETTTGTSNGSSVGGRFQSLLLRGQKNTKNHRFHQKVCAFWQSTAVPPKIIYDVLTGTVLCSQCSIQAPR